MNRLAAIVKLQEIWKDMYFDSYGLSYSRSRSINFYIYKAGKYPVPYYSGKTFLEIIFINLFSKCVELENFGACNVEPIENALTLLVNTFSEWEAYLEGRSNGYI